MIRKLDSVVASRIAAGEVVDKPSSVLRELLDNAIDSKATKVSAYIEEGGIKSIRVTDNGSGISKEDLPLAFERHCTSKISTLDDLFALRTLGFRGEALSSIASCSVLTIESSSCSLTCNNGVMGELTRGTVTEGTSVLMEDLFENIPARKQFLRRASSEAADCKKVFLEKALGFENVELLLFIDGKLFIRLPSQSRVERVNDIFSLDRSFVRGSLVELNREADPINIHIVCATPDVYKRDRTQIKILVNNRIVDSYQLVTAVNNAYSAALPGGAFPFFCLYIEDSPTLVDFNIHPSKRECKIRNQSTIYGLVTNMIRDYLYNRSENTYKGVVEKQEEMFEGFDLGEKKTEYKPSSTFSAPHHTAEADTPRKTETAPAFKPDPKWFEAAKNVLGKKSESVDTAAPSVLSAAESAPERTWRYIGQVFNTFLVVETGEDLLFIDQHAAHERILYDEIRSLKDVQPLMIPYTFETDRSTDDFLLENSYIYREFGVELVRSKSMQWEMLSIPAVCRKNEDEIVKYITTATGDVESARKGLFAIIACHAAIKAGDVLDNITARALVEKVFKLDQMLCPHGRSFTFKITREELYKAVGRIV
ncbi:MAG: DNA mismatch repair endonuclease MutL [Sphaerochaetaceae bacterium]|nr:DNA mismatch repair endonuclease MutL [Sphaerochaetaceae bacterium]